MVMQKFSIPFVVLAAALVGSASAQQVVAEAAPPAQSDSYIIGTGIQAPSGLLYGLPLRQRPASADLPVAAVPAATPPLVGSNVAPVVLAPSLPPPAVAGQAAAPAAPRMPAAPAAVVAGSTTSPLCVDVVARLEQAVKAKPHSVLEETRRALLENDACACEIIKTAIRTSTADSSMVGQIVEVALITQPARYNEIVDCAISASPDSKAAVRAALERAFGTKSGKGGKSVVLSPQMPPPQRVLVREIPKLYFPPVFNRPPGPPPSEEPPDDPPPGGRRRRPPPATPSNPVLVDRDVPVDVAAVRQPAR
jgi:hypothetical protein